MQRFAPQLLAIMLLLGGGVESHASKRVALVIGNSAYEHTQFLPNPKNDARAIAAKLKEIGFETVTTATDLGADGMRRALSAFGDAADGADTALVFFAGHGMELGGENYLIPTDAKLKRDRHLKFEAIKLSSVLESVEGARRLRLVVLDACRNNPFAATMRYARGAKRSVARGFERVEPESDVLVAYAARHGTTADDGTGRHSPYTTALLAHMAEPGVDIRLMLGKVRDSVKNATAGGQVPHTYGTLGGSSFFLVPPDTGKSQETVTRPPLSPAAQAWEAVKTSTDPAVLEAFLNDFPKGVFAALAKSRLRSLGEQKVAVGVYPQKEEPTPSRSYKPGDAFQDCPECPTMVVVPAGSFMMGSPDGEKDRADNEGPQRRVTIKKPFAVGQFEVTFAEWDACFSDGVCSHKPSDKGWGRNRRPVIQVSWEDAKSFVSWLSRKTGKTYRLLSESEWEYAARAGSTTPFSTGEIITAAQANYDGNHTYNNSQKDRFRMRTVTVGSFAPNAFGLHDLHGNVWEWTEDCWNLTYNGAPADGTPWTSGDCNHRVLRGGSWHNGPWSLRSANRDGYTTVGRSNLFGFRVARTLASEEFAQTQTYGQPKPETKVAVGVYPKTEEPAPKRGYKPGDAFQDCVECPKMVVLPSGSFVMGSPKDEEGRRFDKDPQHRVTITKPFAVGKFEVTFAEWYACVSDGGCSHEPDDEGWGRDRRPVTQVSWDDAKSYVSWLSRKTGRTYRLLSEAEWEYAARAGTTTPFSTGRTITTDQANFDGNYTYDGSRTGQYRNGTVTVGSFAPNAFGLHDMHGNVWEWVEDCWNRNYVGAPSDGSSRTSGDCSRREVRGGSWLDPPRILRSANSFRFSTNVRLSSCGFRIARALTSDEMK